MALEVLFQQAPTWTQSRQDFVVAAVLVGILLIGLYVMVRIILAARRTEAAEIEALSERA